MWKRRVGFAIACSFVGLQDLMGTMKDEVGKVY